ncbi:MAG: hypothetical protein EDX89_16470 [Acidobacteria bacterium]|nr:MAG: hypothetical protein EDX89_16470 [Acidobacteriota bacterium]
MTTLSQPSCSRAPSSWSGSQYRQSWWNQWTPLSSASHSSAFSMRASSSDEYARARILPA